MSNYMTPEFIRIALDQVATRDPDLAAALHAFGYPSPRNREPGFSTLINIIISQQVSTNAATAIRGRLEATLDPLTPDAFLAADEQTIRDIGFSARKAEYARGLAQAIVDGTLETERLAGLDDKDVAKALTSIRGLGQWSADIYMLFTLSRADVWPLGDLAIQIAVQKLKHMRKRPNQKHMLTIAERWRPYRGVVALFLWHYYKGAP